MKNFNAMLSIISIKEDNAEDSAREVIKKGMESIAVIYLLKRKKKLKERGNR